MIGPSFSIASENRSSVSRAPVRSSELTSMRHRIQANARRILSTLRSSRARRLRVRRRRPGSMNSSSRRLGAVGAPARSSSIGPCATSRPLAMTPMWVDSRSTISRMCEVRKIVPPRRDERLQQILDLARGHRVDAFERLVEKEQPRRRQQRRRERQLLAHAVREVGDERRRRRPSRSISVEQIAGAVARGRGRRCRGPAPTNVSVSCAVSRSNSARSSGTTPIRRLTATGSASGSMPRMRIEPAVGRSSPVRHLIVVDLPAPFGPEESVEAAGRHGEVDAVHGAERPKSRVSAVRLDREFHAPDCIPARTVVFAIIAGRRSSRMRTRCRTMPMNRLAQRAQPVPAAARRATRSTGTHGATRRSTRARREDKPIFLSIGYSTCHWCHVMEHESFENAGDRRRC